MAISVFDPKKILIYRYIGNRYYRHIISDSRTSNGDSHLTMTM